MVNPKLETRFEMAPGGRWGGVKEGQQQWVGLLVK